MKMEPGWYFPVLAYAVDVPFYPHTLPKVGYANICSVTGSRSESAKNETKNQTGLMAGDSHYQYDDIKNGTNVGYHGVS